MTYTKQELMAISTAACTLSTYTNAALYTLDTFMEMYLENQDNIKDLISRLEQNPDRIYVELFAVKQMIKEIKLELDAYISDDSYVLRHYFSEAKERQEIFNALSGKAV